MSNSALMIAPASATKWTVVSGPMKGTVRLMNAPVFVVGRSPECELVLINDPKCSRRHAQVESSGYGCEVVSLNEQNPVLVNGRAVERAALQDGDILTFGDTEVQYNHTSASAGGADLVLPDSMGGAGAPTPFQPGHATSQGTRTRKSRSSTRGPRVGSQRLIIYGVIGALLFWLLSPSKAKKKAVQIRTEAQIQADIETANKLREASEMQAMRKVDQSVTSRQAQENYIRGFRDYKKGQFERSLISFQSCLALNPEHILCNRYLRLAQRKFDELVQYQMVLGRKYRDQNQYAACRSSFRNIMVMVKDANNPVYQEAKANYEACDAMVEGRF